MGINPCPGNAVSSRRASIPRYLVHAPLSALASISVLPVSHCTTFDLSSSIPRTHWYRLEIASHHALSITRFASRICFLGQCVLPFLLFLPSNRHLLPSCSFSALGSCPFYHHRINVSLSCQSKGLPLSKRTFLRWERELLSLLRERAARLVVDDQRSTVVEVFVGLLRCLVGRWLKITDVIGGRTRRTVVER